MVLNGHEHNYQRWKPLNGNGAVDPSSPTQFVVGTGGHEQLGFGSDSRIVKKLKTNGALKLTLSNSGAAYQFITTGGKVYDSGSIACNAQQTPTPTATPTATATAVVGPPTIRLSRDKSKFNGIVGVTLSGYTPNTSIAVTWSDSSTLATIKADSQGNATTSFRTPLVPYGTYTVRAADENGKSNYARLGVIPRVKLTPTSGHGGTTIRIYFYGYVPNFEAQVRFYTSDGSGYTALKTIPIADNGRGTTLIAIPSGAETGQHKIQGKIVGLSKSASAVFTVISGGTAASADLSPPATVTETISPTGTPNPAASPVVTGTPDTTYAPTVGPTSEFDWTATPTVTGTPDVTDVEPTETATATEAATPVDTPSGPTPYPVVQTKRSASTTSGTNAVDGDPAAVWQTAPDTDPGRIAILTLDLGAARRVDRVRLLAGPDGLLGSATLETSMDGDHWSYFATPIAAAAIEDDWLTIVPDPGAAPAGTPIPVAGSGTVTARYVRVVFVNDQNPPVLGGVAEVQVWPPDQDSDSGG